MIFNIELVKASELSESQQSGFDALSKECSGEVTEQEIVENFIVEPFAYFFAMDGKQMISHVALFKREVEFAGQKILVGGIGRVCVSSTHRHHGVVSSMLKRALLVLREEKCDVAYLHVDSSKKTYPVYETLGFKLINQDHGAMFAQISSSEKFELTTKWWHSR